MELKVWVEGIQRIVCGVTVNTTCQDVVFALAHATGKVGRFTLIERWRNNERLLAPNENPLKLLLKWGEYANDVQFILQRSENKQQLQQQQTRVDVTTGGNNKHNNNDGNNMKIHNNSNNNIVGGDNKNTQMINSVMKKPLGLSNNNNSNNNNNNYNNNTNTIQHNIESAYNDQQQQQQTNDLNLNSMNEKRRELKKSFGAYDGKHNENIGIVKGIPQRHNINIQQQQQYQHQQQQQYQHKSTPSPSNAPSAATTRNTTELPNLIPKHEKSHSNPIDMMNSYAYNNNNNNNSNNSGMGSSTPYNDSNSNNLYNQIGAYNSKSINEINLAVVRSSLDRRTNDNEDLTDMVFSANHTFGQTKNNNNSNIIHNQNNSQNNGSTNSNENLLDVYNGNSKYNAMNTSPDIYKNAPTISAIGALVPPPYRDPPPPRNSPLQSQQPLQRMHVDNVATSPVAQNGVSNSFSSDYANDFDFDYQSVTNSQNSGGGNGDNGGTNNNNMDESESIFQATQYNDLLQLIKFQREKISAQQVELNKYDAEIGFLENKERDQAHELDVISREITKADSIFRQGSDQLQALQYVEEENELVKQQEKTLKSEIALLRSKLANCETELLQCKNKIRILMDDIEMEQRTISTKHKNNRQNVERDFLMEMERIQSEIDQAIHNADSSNKTTDSLKKEILLIENAIAEKKRQVEQLVNEMKEVNLQSLTVTTSEEIKHLLEGSNKPGSTRRIIGSPRQLENAVPTSKNPHGVWV